MKNLFNSITYYLKLIHSEIVFFHIINHSFKCEKLGNPGADWWIPLGFIDKNSICYSGGVGQDVSFDLELIKKYGTIIHAFDPTPKSIAFIKEKVTKKQKNFHFYPIGIWKNNSEQKFYFPKNNEHVSHSIVNLQKTNQYFVADCKTIKKIMSELNHKKIDLLKIDIEGAEYVVLEKMIKDKISPKIICVEFDQPTQTQKILSMVNNLSKHGYSLIKKSYYNFTFLKI